MNNQFRTENNKKTAFVNGKIYTVNENQPWAESVIVHKNKIIFVGNEIAAKELIDSETEIIDLDGKLMLPGFIDSHVHLMLGGFSNNEVNLINANSKEEFISTIDEYSKSRAKGWIIGWGWNHEQFDIPKLPSK